MAVAAVFLASALRADSAPDWLHAAAQEKLPAYSDEPIAVFLLDETQTSVMPNGDIESRHRVAVRILRPRGQDEYGYAEVPFDNETKITSFKGWTITADGHEFALGEKDAIERGVSTYEIFTDNREKALKFTAAEPGAVVGYEYVQKQRQFVFEDSWMFQAPVPVHRTRFVLQLPAGWEYSTYWLNYPEHPPQTTGPNQYLWDLTDIPATKDEPDMPPYEAVAGQMGVKFFPQDPAQRAKTMGTWNDLGLWFDSLTATSRTASPQITQKVAELTAGMTDPIAKMQALAGYVQSQIRYAAIEIGIGNLQPHPAADVFSRQYGDCKDKATLLSTMLQVAGIESYYVVVDTDRGVVHPDYPSLRFDHVIVAIRIPGGATGGGLFATVDDPKLGRLLFFDPTDEYVPLGYLPTELQDNYGLVVAPTGGTLMTMPLLPASTNRLLRTASLTLSPSGDLAGEVKELRWGAPAQEEREMFMDAQPSKRAEIFENFLGEFLRNFQLTGASIGNLDKYDDTLSLDYKFASQGYAKMAGDELLVRPRILGDKYTRLLDLFAQNKPRQYPIQFDSASRQDDVFEIAMPAGYVLDREQPPVSAACDFATYTSKVEVTGNVLRYTRTMQIKSVMVPTEKLADVKQFLQKVAADQEMFVALRPGPPSPAASR
jgi:transglutaminase-like putative cysteine protease